MALDRLTKSNFVSQPGPKFKVYDYWYNILVDRINEISTDDTSLVADTISENTSGSGVTIDGVLLKDNGVSLTSTVTEYTKLVTLTATEIVGTDAGDIGHAAGAVLVAAPGAGYLLEFVSAVLIFDYSTAAYTGGNNDLVIRQGTTSVSAAIADADLIGDSADDIAYVNALAAADIKLTANSTLNLKGTAYTNPGTAAGVLRVHLTYRVHTTGL